MKVCLLNILNMWIQKGTSKIRNFNKERKISGKFFINYLRNSIRNFNLVIQSIQAILSASFQCGSTLRDIANRWVAC